MSNKALTTENWANAFRDHDVDAIRMYLDQGRDVLFNHISDSTRIPLTVDTPVDVHGTRPIMFLLGNEFEPQSKEQEESLLQMINVLIERGASLTRIDHRCLRPIDLAMVNGLPRVALRLAEATMEAYAKYVTPLKPRFDLAFHTALDAIDSDLMYKRLDRNLKVIKPEMQGRFSRGAPEIERYKRTDLFEFSHMDMPLKQDLPSPDMKRSAIWQQWVIAQAQSFGLRCSEADASKARSAIPFIVEEMRKRELEIPFTEGLAYRRFRNSIFNNKKLTP